MDLLLALFLIFIIHLVGLQLRDLFRLFLRWVAPVFPLADSRRKKYLRKSALDIALAALMSYAVVSIVVASALFGRRAGLI